jgi:hypothetical protein
MKYILLFSICFCFLSCKKDSGSNNPSNTRLLTNSDWKYDNGGIGDASGNIIVDFNTAGIMIPSCTLDNTIHFNASGNGTIAENANVCSGLPATTPFTWSFSSNETVLNLSAGAIAGIGGSFKIKELSDTKLTLLKDTTASLLGSTTAVTAVVNLKR